MALITVTDKKGTYQKYKPTKEEAIEMFLGWKNLSVIKPFELPMYIKENLAKWDMMDIYPEVKAALKIKEDKVGE